MQSLVESYMSAVRGVLVPEHGTDEKCSCSFLGAGGIECAERVAENSPALIDGEQSLLLKGLQQGNGDDAASDSVARGPIVVRHDDPPELLEAPYTAATPQRTVLDGART